jgi:hypothetical protein
VLHLQVEFTIRQLDESGEIMIPRGGKGKEEMIE